MIRKTDKGLPQYDDAGESDVFLLSGTEDLVPVLTADARRLEDRATEPGFVIHRYRPRIEGLFARIRASRTDQRATSETDPEMLHFEGVFSFHHWTKRGEPVFIPGEAAANLARAADRTT